MLSFNILVYAGQCRECGTFNRHIVIVAGDDENKTEAIMKARFLQCKHCRHKLISSKERKIPETIFLIRNKRTVDFQVDNKTRELAFLKSPYHILIDLNELQKAGFLGIVQIKGRENTSSVYHILENRIIPFHFRNENRRE